MATYKEVATPHTKLMLKLLCKHKFKLSLSDNQWQLVVMLSGWANKCMLINCLHYSNTFGTLSCRNMTLRNVYFTVYCNGFIQSKGGKNIRLTFDFR